MKTMILVALAVARHASIPPGQSPGRRKSAQPGVPHPDPLSRAGVASVSASPAILSSLVHRPMVGHWEFAPSVPIALKCRYP